MLEEVLPYSSISSLIHSWLMLGRASGHQKVAPLPMDRLLPDGDCSTSGQINSSKVLPNVG